MKSLSHIDKSGFRKGEYVGYTSKGCQRIRHNGSEWRTYALGSSSGQFVSLSADTLESLNQKLTTI